VTDEQSIGVLTIMIFIVSDIEPNEFCSGYAVIVRI